MHTVRGAGVIALSGRRGRRTCNNALSCMLSREMFSGMSSLSTTPKMKRSHWGRIFDSGSMRTL